MNRISFHDSSYRSDTLSGTNVQKLKYFNKGGIKMPKKKNSKKKNKKKNVSTNKKVNWIIHLDANGYRSQISGRYI